jgi:hypothetical protein
MTVIGINTTALMMLLRYSRLFAIVYLVTNIHISIYAMYSGKPLVVVGVAIAFCIEFGVNAWLLSHGIGTCTWSSNIM